MIRLALRSVARRRGRTAATAGLVGLCVAALATRHSITEAIERFSHEAVVETRTGAVVVRPPGAFESVPLGAPETLDAQTVAALRAVPGVAAAASRIHLSAMLSDGRTETPVVVRGVEPDVEPRVCPRFSRELRAGGRWLSGQKALEGVVGYGLSDALGLTVGQTVTLSSSGTARANALQLEVVAISESGLALENRRVITVPLEVAQALGGLGDGVTELGLAADGLSAAELRERVAGALGDVVEARSWQDVHPLARDNIERQHRNDAMTMLVLLAVVTAALLALGLLAVDERAREIGTMLSFGARRSQVAALFFWEGVALGGFGAVLGLVLSLGVTFWLSRIGIEVQHMGAAHPAVLRPALSGQTVAWGSAFALVASAATGALVAWRTSRLEPVEALRK